MSLVRLHGIGGAPVEAHFSFSFEYLKSKDWFRVFRSLEVDELDIDYLIFTIYLDLFNEIIV